MQRKLHSHRERGGFSWLLLLISVALFAVGGYFVWPYFAGADGEDSKAFEYKVTRGRFVHEITEQGEIQSSENVEVHCQVKSTGGQGVQILELFVEEGERVEKGAKLAKLDSSALEDQLRLQKIAVSNAEANAIQAENLYETALIAKNEYLEGTFKQEEQLIESEIFVAEENLKRAEEYLEYSKKLARRNYVTQLQLQADEFAVEKAKKELQNARTKLAALQNFTMAKMAKQLDTDIKTAKAQLTAFENTYELEEQKLTDILKQIENCTVVAPAGGEVVYANERESRRGSDEVQIAKLAFVHENQVMFRLPDSSKMRARTKVNESRIGLVKEGMAARIRADAHWNYTLDGEVTKVENYPAPSRWSNSNVREYYTYVQIKNAPKGELKSGMMCQVTIRIGEEPDVLLAKIQSVYERDGKHHCLVKKNGKRVEQPVVIGRANDTHVIIRDGLSDGDVVIENPRKFVKEEKAQRRFEKRTQGGQAAPSDQRQEGGASGVERPGGSRATGQPTAGNSKPDGDVEESPDGESAGKGDPNKPAVESTGAGS